MSYLLPSHPSILCEDPLGICGDSATVTAWGVISAAILSTTNATLELASASHLPELVETLVYSLHGNGLLDTQGLRLFLHRNYADALFPLYSAIFTAALSLPDVLPTHEIPYLTDQHPKVSLSDDQMNAILAHQLLGTLAPPPGGWGSPTFTCWYAGSNPHPMAIEGYLRTLFNHFSCLAASTPLHTQFYLAQVAEMLDWEECEMPMQMTLMHIDEESEPSDQEGTPAIVIASNRQPGFGPSGTQEERLFASSLYLCPLVLFCPVLPTRAAIVTSPIPVHAAWRGHNRTARLAGLYPRTSRPNRCYMLMDALELDAYEQPQAGAGLPDLAAGNVERELCKVYAACLGLRTMYPHHTPVVEAGAWGCGAFGGNIVVKGIIMAMASSRAGAHIHLRLLKERIGDLELIGKVIETGSTVGQIMIAMRRNSEATKCQDGVALVQLLLAPPINVTV